MPLITTDDLAVKLEADVCIFDSILCICFIDVFNGRKDVATRGNYRPWLQAKDDDGEQVLELATLHEFFPNTLFN